MNNATKGSFLNICLPSLIYLILGLISTIMMISHSFKVFMALINIVLIIFWTWILNLICKAGYTWVSWVLVLLPFVIILIAFLYLLSVVKKEDYNKYNEYFVDSGCMKKKI
jgi:hypothetical protein